MSMDDLNAKPTAITLSFKDWGYLVGSLLAMSDMLDPEGPMVADIQRCCVEIRGQLDKATWAHVEQEAANEDAN